MSVNPFFKGEKSIEKKMFESHQRKQRELEQTIEVDSLSITSSNMRQQGPDLQVKPKSFLSFLCSWQCLKFQCVWSTENFF